MGFEINKAGNYTGIVSKVEKLDSIVAPDLKAQLVLLDKEGESNFIIDLAETRYCDSSGLSALLVGNRLAKGSGGRLVICGLQAPVKKMIEISQLHTVLSIAGSFDDAVGMI